ncbi:MAG TPA: SDR family oxidoreductase, partial [Edaphobacter sp.]
MNRPVVLITGVGRVVGIGAGIARKLVSDGWDIAICHWPKYDERKPWGVQATDVDDLLSELMKISPASRVSDHIGDFEDAATVRGLMQEVERVHGQISALVLTHCESLASSFLDTSLESFERHFAVNTRANWQLMREFALQAPAQGGRIVALTSDHVVGNVPYGASKGALDRLVLAAAREFGDRQITANIINPGPIDTGWMDEQTRETCLSRQPTGRLGTP